MHFEPGRAPRLSASHGGVPMRARAVAAETSITILLLLLLLLLMGLLLLLHLDQGHCKGQKKMAGDGCLVMAWSGGNQAQEAMVLLLHFDCYIIYYTRELVLRLCTSYNYNSTKAKFFIVKCTS
ncbi:hypothetical protein BDA96_07G060000 [Sorghum bicolor]|uniref:Uncharacterized protein n=2 Tax=Sorghum bicolor TaxID=4558 RepID=A0A921QIT5_SORBI|nr:hypothetical protein BDA96_07G060000 [Sorghum bicolor]OQU79972.1 hypothetical protein SORBI_3007G057450 [Sorghum bicolor]